LDITAKGIGKWMSASGASGLGMPRYLTGRI